MLRLLRYSVLNKTSTDNIINISSVFIRCQSQQQQEPKEMVKDDRGDSAVGPDKVKPKLEPFLKNLFIGRFNNELLTYPELEQENLDKITDYATQVEKTLTTEVNLRNVRENGISLCLDNLKKLEIFDLNVPSSYGGRDWNVTERVYITEATTRDLSISHFISDNQELGIAAVKTYGTSTQRQKYLPKMKNGELFSAFCFHENSTSTDLRSPISTLALKSDDDKYYTITGSKYLVCDAVTADLFIVMTSTLKMEDNKRIPATTMFLVDKNTSGIKVDPPVEKIGCPGLHLSNVHFNNVVVPAENVLGNLHGGLEIVDQIMNRGRLNVGAQCSSIMKQAALALVEHCIGKNHFGTPLSSLAYVQAALGDIVARTYMVESLTYFITGISDNYDNPDVVLENAILKIVAAEETNYVLRKAFEIVGSPAYLKDHPLATLRSDAEYFLIKDENMHNLKLMVGFLGLQHVGQNMQEVIRKIRNPLMYPKYSLTRFFLNKDYAEDKVNLDLNLHEYLHPTLQYAAKHLEFCVDRLTFISKVMLEKYGNEVSEKHLEVARLAEVAMDVLVLTAVLGRASRSYCIGLRNSGIEMGIAEITASDFKSRVSKITDDVIEAPFVTNDSRFIAVGESIFNEKGYTIEHPLERNF